MLLCIGGKLRLATHSGMHVDMFTDELRSEVFIRVQLELFYTRTLAVVV